MKRDKLFPYSFLLGLSKSLQGGSLFPGSGLHEVVREEGSCRKQVCQPQTCLSGMRIISG